MSLSKTLLVALGLVFAATTFASAAPRQMANDTSTSADTWIPGKAHQDKFLSN